jgi:hypothetical protein
VSKLKPSCGYFSLRGFIMARGGPELTEFDALNALEKWVERGPPPKLIACHRDNGIAQVPINSDYRKSAGLVLGMSDYPTCQDLASHS